MIDSLKFSTWIEAQAAEIRKSRSGEKTRLKLLAAGARLLDAVGYRDLNIEEIAAEAGLAKGTFYIYCASKDDFLIDLARRFIAFEPHTLPQLAPQDTAFANTLRFITWYERSFVRNIGILRCIIQMGETDETMRAIWHQRNRVIAEHTLEATLRQTSNPDLDANLLLLALRSTGGMLDQSLFNRFRVQTDTGQPGHDDPDYLCLLHAVLSYRAIYGESPPDDEAAGIVEALRLKGQR